jgi:hypothetical protein
MLCNTAPALEARRLPRNNLIGALPIRAAQNYRNRKIAASVLALVKRCGPVVAETDRRRVKDHFHSIEVV